jgi:hypothetical protein
LTAAASTIRLLSRVGVPHARGGAGRSEPPNSKFLDLDRLCSWYTEATVLNENTVRTQGTVLRIPPGPGSRGYAKARVEVRQLLDGSWRIYHQERLATAGTAT